jgi:4-hydroxy-tetrahydrodipicolinate synthase
MIHGAYTAMITPFRDGQVDHDRLSQNIEQQITAGVDGLVPVGTTGESPTLTHDEHRAVVEAVVKKVDGRVRVVAGAGSNSTAEALELTKHAQSVGADVAMLVNPYYNKPTQEGLYRHFGSIADAVEIPVLLYNIPGRTGVTCLPETVERLSHHGNIIGVKEATGSMDIASEIAMRCGREFVIMSGDDSLTLPLMSVGAKGVVSVVSNLLPGRVKELVGAATIGDFAAAQRHHLALFPLFKACLSLATNPITIKTAMMLAGRDTGQMRLPLCEMDPAKLEQLKELLKPFDVLA